MTNKMIKTRNPVKTKLKLLKTAAKLFAKQGFAATSTLQIAKAADLNEALIFHYFGSKAKLWEAVKLHLFAQLKVPAIHPEPESFEFFLEQAIHQRVYVYQQSQELRQLMQWQKLEKNAMQMKAGNVIAPKNWFVPLRHLQGKKMIRTDIAPEMIAIWLTGSLNIMIFDQVTYFKEADAYERYLQMLKEGFKKIFLD